MLQVFMISSNDPTNDIRIQKEKTVIEKIAYQHVQLVYPDKKLKFPKPIWFIIWQIKEYFKIKRTQGNRCHIYFQYATYHCHDLDTLLLGIMLKRKFGGILVFDSHEYYLWIISKFPEFIVYPYFRILQYISIYHVDYLIVISETMKDYFEKRYKFKNIIIVRNTQ